MTFVDILGFADLVHETTAAEVDEILDAIAQTAGLPLDAESSGTTALQFSDSVIRARELGSDSIYDALLEEIQELATAQWMLLQVGVLVRGGTTVGDVSMTNGRAFGPAFVRAYRLESTLAGSPRIVIDPSVIADLRSHVRSRPVSQRRALIADLRDHVRHGDDGVWFIDFLNSARVVNGSEVVEKALGGIREFVVAEARKFTSNPSVLPKYLWLVRYHNQFVRRSFRTRPELRVKTNEVPASDEFLKPRLLQPRLRSTSGAT
ncbi:hypothetical protein U1708_07970 [Sphingomonas sp. ZB1N12]|uniref:hypothetical protein n=1 Tax=Sphingomonas arabinosi TaxID=3096160 RepID=UPI002FC96013